MGEIVNFNRYRKRMGRKSAADKAAENRAREGQKREERLKALDELSRHEKTLDDKKVD